VTGSPRVLVLGASGMLGNALYRYIAAHGSIELLGTERRSLAASSLPQGATCRIVSGVDVEEGGRLGSIIESFRPTLLVNCIAAGTRANAREAIALNALLPHRLAQWAERVGARLLHIGTDGVFSGAAGARSEEDVPDATDLYGRTKLLGEVSAPHSLTLRTSIVGPELGAGKGLLSWFKAQRGTVKGFRRAIFSGFTTLELSRIIVGHVLPRPDLSGVLHVSSQPISKFDLLSQVAEAYGMEVEVEPDDVVAIDRSLDSTRFRALTGYRPPDWTDMVARMRDFG
jgi:dTDP-4-dehydrorhamnose reductase